MRNLRLGRGSLRDAGDLHLGVRLTMPTPPRPAFLLLAEVEHLPKPVLGDDLPRHLHVLHQRLTHLRALRAAEQEHLVEGDVAAHVASDLLDPEDVALGDPVLLSAGTNDCVHPKPLYPKGPSIYERRTKPSSSGHPASSFFFKSSLTMAGFPFPFIAFITCPTKNPKTFFLPLRYRATSSAFLASTSSTTASIAVASLTCASPFSAMITWGSLPVRNISANTSL